jgi:hypothetical protein
MVSNLLKYSNTRNGPWDLIIQRALPPDPECGKKRNEKTTKNIEDLGREAKMSTVKDDTTACSSWSMVNGPRQEVSRLGFFHEDNIFCLSV